MVLVVILIMWGITVKNYNTFFYDDIGWVISEEKDWQTSEDDAYHFIQRILLPGVIVSTILLINADPAMATIALKETELLKENLIENDGSFQRSYKIYKNNVEIVPSKLKSNLKESVKRVILNTPKDKLFVDIEIPMIDLDLFFKNDAKSVVSKVNSNSELITNIFAIVKSKELLYFGSGILVNTLSLRGGFVADIIKLGSFAYENYRKKANENENDIFRSDKPQTGYSIPGIGQISAPGAALLATLIYLMTRNRKKGEILNIPTIFSKPSSYERFINHLGRHKVVYLAGLSGGLLVLYLTKESNGVEKILAASLSQIERAQKNTIQTWKRLTDVLTSSTSETLRDVKKELLDLKKGLGGLTEKHTDLRVLFSKTQTLLDACSTTAGEYQEIAGDSVKSYEQLYQSMSAFLLTHGNTVLNDGSRVKDLFSLESGNPFNNYQNKLRLLNVETKQLKK